MEISITRKGDQGQPGGLHCPPIGGRMNGINGQKLSVPVIHGATGSSLYTVKIKGIKDTKVEFFLSLPVAESSKPHLAKLE